MSERCAVVVLAKAPVAGFAKTRLIGALGAEGAAQLAARLLDHAVAQAVAAGIGPVEACCTPDATHPAFVALAQRLPVGLSVQRGGDLGVRLQAALARALERHPRAIVLGTDAPGLDAAFLREAAARLASHDAVVGPARDGGYTLLGVRAAPMRLFEGIDWSTSQVLIQTRERLHELGWKHAELAELADIDEPADLAALPPGWRDAMAAARP